MGDHNNNKYMKAVSGEEKKKGHTVHRVKRGRTRTN